MEKIFFYRKLSNQIFDKIRNYTKYFRQVKYHSPQAFLEEQKSLSKDFHVSVEVCTSNLSRDMSKSSIGHSVKNAFPVTVLIWLKT